MNVVKSEYSIEDLEQFRDKDGFIDLSKAGIEFTLESREIEGNPYRDKNWVDFAGKKVLIKGEAKIEDESNYGIYAELIVEEISKYFGRDTAHYDLIKYKDENGQEVRGVLSESVIDLENEQLVTLRDLIGDEPEDETKYPDTTSLEYTLKGLERKLTEDGYEKTDIARLITDYKKDLLFYSIYLLDVDKHVENIGFVKKKVDGRDIIELSKNYDSEAALMLDYNISTIKDILDGDISGLKIAVEEAHPRIGSYKTIEDHGLGSYWMDTLEDLCDDDEIYDYYCMLQDAELDMDEIFERVEARIGAALPEEAKQIAKYSHMVRTQEMEKVMSGEIEIPGQSSVMDPDKYLEMIINATLQKETRAGEQVDIGEKMERDMKTPQVDLSDMLNKLLQGEGRD